MHHQSALTLIDPTNGNLAFKVMGFDDYSYFDHIQRLNYYSLIWVQEGDGKATVDFAEYPLAANTLLAMAPYQPFMLQGSGTVQGVALHFHPDFFCIMRHHNEVSCNGVLFNNAYQPPTLQLDAPAIATMTMAIEQMRTEMQNTALAQYELLIAYLKIVLITAARLKTQQHPELALDPATHKEPFILQKLKDAIEAHYKEKHAPQDYADLLYLAPKTLAKITKTHFNKTLSSLINERIIIEAKRELYLTSKPVKQIAYELGYTDEYYFSRFFKVNADVSPQGFRETVGFARGEG